MSTPPESSLKKPWHLSSKLISWGIGITVFILIWVIMTMIKITPYAPYVNSRFGITVKYPAYWKVVSEPKVEGGVAVFISPRESELDPFSENVSIAFNPLTTQEITLDRFSHITVMQLKGTFGDYMKITRAGPATLGGKHGWQIFYVGQIQDAHDNMRYWNVWTVTSKGTYIITYAAPSASFQKYFPKAKKIVNSFRFLDSEINKIR